ncbi:MAG TPA: UvrB/UvrC motif-containing protein [Thermoguttaceae bacterium]|nr:UvrB/UvrC motif-containing protein [Thermoguttaceae bacterium]
MSDTHDIDHILNEWPHQSGVISARLVRAGDGREVVQMRVEMGVLQMEAEGRPDGEHPEGADTYLDALIQLTFGPDDAFELTEKQCFEVDREFMQFYHRRICWLALREFDRAIADADHTLALMDFAAEHASNSDWGLSHEQYRPFVLFHRTQAASLRALQGSGAESAIEEINHGLQSIHEVFAAAEAEEDFAEDELVGQLVELKESLRDEYHVGPTLAEQLAEAVANEEFERAAELRDQMARRPDHH